MTGRARPAVGGSRVRIAIRLTPGAGVDRIDGVVEGVLRARVAAPPVEGAANEALTRLVADVLGIARRRVTLVRGARNRLKVVELDGIDPGVVKARWPGADV